MKKLMIAAAAAAMVGGAYAADCIGCGANNVILVQPKPPTYIETTTTECVAGHVWDLSIKAKTLAYKCVPCKSICKECGDADKAKYLDDTSRTFTGVAWTCYCPCLDTDKDDIGDTLADTYMLFWDAKAATGFGHIIFQYTEVVPEDPIPGATYYEANWTVDAVSETESFRYGKKAEKASFGFAYEGTGNNLKETLRDQTLVVGARGLGKVKTYKVKGNLPYLVIDKITGAATGEVTYCACPAAEDEEKDEAKVIPVCFDFSNWCEDGEALEDGMAPFYGTFTMKYNSKKSQTLRTTPSYLQKLFPAYCVKVVMP